jgi:hypothetical protein
MRISATDIDDGNNSIVAYELHTLREDERGYFRVDRATGVITLNRTIDVSTKLQFNPFEQVKNNYSQPIEAISAPRNNILTF